MKRAFAMWLRRLANRADPDFLVHSLPQQPAQLLAPSHERPHHDTALVFPAAYVAEVNDAQELVAHIERLADAIGAGRRHVHTASH